MFHQQSEGLCHSWSPGTELIAQAGGTELPQHGNTKGQCKCTEKAAGPVRAPGVDGTQCQRAAFWTVRALGVKVHGVGGQLSGQCGPWGWKVHGVEGSSLDSAGPWGGRHRASIRAAFWTVWSSCVLSLSPLLCCSFRVSARCGPGCHRDCGGAPWALPLWLHHSQKRPLGK